MADTGGASGRAGLEDTAGADPVLLTIRDVSRSFGGVLAVNRASAGFAKGQITGIIGPNGAGKSTLLNIVTGSLRADSGQILFDGQSIERWPTYRRARLGIGRTFQLSSEFKRLTLVENLLCGVRLTRGETLRGAVLGPRWWGKVQEGALSRAAEILARFALEEKGNELAGSLSGGERRLVEIGRALMSEPRLLLLDEPLAGVHPRNVGRIIEALRSLRDEGVTLVTCLHEPDAVERACDSVAVMAQGSVIAVGSFDEVRANSSVLGAYLGS
ncbi:MAG: ABC transporter ATP-binding protein [Acidimicrobiales bacterium]|jgi:branched-chain amino acid transport system ATP-binding protein